ncbi:DUF362 domain-containing protein [Adlercreutzia sp. R25]|uniref:DUF362 domain-containing protein n=1 Tax=Adlercreutzia shanghongiae TaxID=3111773 RepID=UPI002DB8CA35|nr:DUF362 domain-containing protein [Adlercreutzia sp. R25]MEC4271913.1 DUF362 domain-containing protein [Adlercreutzia sp. R25]
MAKPKVFFTREITPENVVLLYEMLGVKLPGKVAVKVHSGEKGNQNYLRPAFMKPMIEEVDGTIVECNTAYDGARDTTEKHEKLMAEHGWSELFDVDIMDAECEDIIFPIENGRVLSENRVGGHMANYASMLVLSHFKGHPMGGFGGALKQLSIGCASNKGKVNIHTAGATLNQGEFWEKLAEQDDFLEAMAEAAETVVNHFGSNLAFVSVACNLSVDCDCCAVAEDPCMADIGIFASLDPVAIDQACIDAVLASDDPGRDHLLERINSKHGTKIIDDAAHLGYGSKDYDLIVVEKGQVVDQKNFTTTE